MTLHYVINAQSSEMLLLLLLFLPCNTTIVESFLPGEDDPQSSTKVLRINAHYLTQRKSFINLLGKELIVITYLNIITASCLALCHHTIQSPPLRFVQSLK